MTVPITDEQLAILQGMGEPMSASDAPKLIRAFIYGPPKIGKTDLVARCVQAIGGKAMWISTDSGWSTVLKYPELAKDIWKIPFDSFGHIRLIVQAREEGHPPFCDYDTLVLDTANGAIDHMLRVTVKQHPLPKEQYHSSLEARGHYRLVEQALKDTVTVIKNSGMHVFYTAHVRNPSDDDKKNNIFSIRPEGPEASVRVLSQEVNFLGWLSKEKPGSERQIQLEPTNRVTAGIQIPTIQEKTYPANEIPGLLAKFTKL